MPDIFVDNRTPSLVFDDTNRLSDSMYNFANAIASAPAAQAKIRQQQQQIALANAWHAQEEARKDRAEAAQSLWRDREYKLGEDKIAALRGANGVGGKPPPAHILKDINARVLLEQEKRGLMKADPITGKVGPVMANGRMKPEDANAMEETRLNTFLASGIDPQSYRPVGAPQQIPLPSPEQQLAQQNAQDPQVAGLFGKPAGAGGHTQRAAAGDAASVAAEQDHHAQNIAQLYKAGNIPAAQKWIGQMRAQWGDDFAEGVKQRVRALVTSDEPAAQDDGDAR